MIDVPPIPYWLAPSQTQLDFLFFFSIIQPTAYYSDFLLSI